MNRISKFISLYSATFFLVFLMPITASALTAKEIMNKVDKRYTGESSESIATLTLIDKKNRKRIRQIKAFSKEYSSGSKGIQFFMSPSDVKDTSYLSFDWDDPTKEDDSWLYLPALQKANRVAGGDKSNSFMGSDFTFSDLSGPEIDDFSYKILRQSDLVDGKDCWVIESIPINKKVIKETGYLKTISWIRKDIFLNVKGIISVQKGKKVKLFSAKNIVKINGVWVAKKVTMVTTKKKKVEHSSVYSLNSIEFDVSLDDEIFNVEAMQRGL
jgi:hypothetical protein